jgi:hypothetical protein
MAASDLATLADVKTWLSGSSGIGTSDDALLGRLITDVSGAIAAFVAGKGWIPADTATNIGAGVIAILAAIWSWQTNVPGKTVK